MKKYRFSAVITREGKFYVSDCPELGITSQGLSLDEALANLKEAIELYLRDEELDTLLSSEEAPLITSIEVTV